MLVTPHRAAADRMRRARLPVGLGLEGLRRHRRALRHPPAAGAARIGSAAGADLHAGHQGAERARHQHHAKRTPPNSSASACSIACGSHAAPLRRRRRRTPNRAASSSPTRSSSSGCCRSRRRRPAGRRPHHPDRRGAHAGFLALLAEGSATARAARNRASTNSSCATISSGSAGTSSRRCRRCPTMSWRRRARNTSRRSAASPGGSST